jgi:hypothetical protein
VYPMGLGSSLFLIAAGAILRYAITVTSHAVNLKTVGLILMIVGVVGFVVWLFWMVMWADRRRTVDAPPSAESQQYRNTDPRY